MWTNLSPLAAEDCALKYEARRRDWQQLIFSRIAIIQILEHILNAQSARGAIDVNGVDQEAAHGEKQELTKRPYRYFLAPQLSASWKLLPLAKMIRTKWKMFA